MSTHSIQFCDKIRKCPLIFVLLSYRKNFVGKGLKNEFELARENEPLVFELSRFDCMGHHSDPEAKKQNMQSKHPGSPRP